MKKIPKKSGIGSIFRRQISLQTILLVGLLYLVIFSYIPMVGVIISFKQYKLSTGLLGFFTSDWVGFKWFEEFFSGPMCFTVVRNTLVLSLLKLCIAFPIPIIFALMLNEMRSEKFKRVVQTASYLPHFISWIIVSGLCFTMFSSVNGLVNELLINLGWIDKPLTILTEGTGGWPWAPRYGRRRAGTPSSLSRLSRASTPRCMRRPRSTGPTGCSAFYM